MSDCYFYDVMDRTGYFDEQKFEHICSLCNGGIYSDEDGVRIGDTHFHAMCLEEMGVLKALSMFGIEMEEY